MYGRDGGGSGDGVRWLYSGGSSDDGVGMGIDPFLTDGGKLGATGKE